MAASGINNLRHTKPDDPGTVRWDHLEKLVEFALELKKALQCINEQSFNHFVLKMGINHGPITAGVIGARKPHYDIWGNTVNVASRMESTGKAGAIQVRTTFVIFVLKYVELSDFQNIYSLFSFFSYLLLLLFTENVLYFDLGDWRNMPHPTEIRIHFRAKRFSCSKRKGPIDDILFASKFFDFLSTSNRADCGRLRLNLLVQNRSKLKRSLILN